MVLILRTIATYLPAIACGVMMLLICIPMMRNMNKIHGSDDSEARREVGELREEVARLTAERALDNKAEALNG